MTFPRDRRLVDIWDRLDRAQEHLKDIERMLLAYYNTGLGELRGEFDPQKYQPVPVAFLPGVFDLPETRLYTATGEFLHDLRSALEHLAWALVEANGGKPSESTSFPVLKTRPAANNKGIHPPPGVAGGISATAGAILDRAQPYQWGTRYARHPVWVLDKLWNIDKHRHIALRGLRMEGFSIPDGLPPFTFRMRVVGVAVDGAEVAVEPDDPTVNVDARTTTQVFVHEPRDGVAMPFYGTLQEVLAVTTNIVREAQDRCFQPGIP